MTTRETAATMRRLADAIDKLPGELPIAGGLDEDCAVGAGAMLCYIRDLLTNSPREHPWSTGELLVLLETISRDPDIFPAGVGNLMWAAED
jgi:hypothetical protein